MANVLRLSDVADQALALASDSQLLKDIGSLGSVWTQVAKAITAAMNDPTADVATKLKWLLDNLDQQSVTDIFGTLQLPNLLTSLRDVEARVKAVLPNATALLDPVSASPAAVTWTPGTLNESLQPEADLSLSLSLTGSLTVQAGAAWPFKGDDVTDPLLLIGASGKLSADAAFKLPFQYGDLGVAGAASATPGLQFFFWEPDPTQIFGEAVGEAMGELPDPFDPASVWNAFAHNGLAGLVMTFDGTTSVAVDLTLGKDFDVPNWITGNLGATITVGLQRGSTYQFSVRAAAKPTSQFHDPTLVLSLSRANTSEADWGLSLGLDIDAAPIFGQVHDFLAAKLNAVDSIIQKITPYLTPGTWITQKAQTLLDPVIDHITGNADVQAALRHDVALLLGKTPTADDIATTVKNRISAELGALTGSAEGATDSAVNTVFNQLIAAVPALAATDVAVKLKADLTVLIGQYRDALETLVGNLLNTSSLATIENSLAKVGAKVTAAATDLDNNKVLSAIRDFISKYDALAAKIVAFTADKTKSKISARISFDSKHTDGSQYEVTGTFTSLAGAAGALYHALAFGELSAVRQAIDGAVPGFALDKNASSITQMVGLTQKFGYEFMLFGLDFTASDVLSAEAEIKELPNGTINIGAKGSYDRTVQALGNSRSLNFFTSYDALRTSAAIAAQQPTLRLGITAAQADSNITVGEVTSFLDRLTEFGLISDARKAMVAAQMSKTAMTRGTNANVAGTVTVTQNFTEADIKTLLAVGSAITNSEAPSMAGLGIFASGAHALFATGALSPGDFGNLLEDFSYRAEIKPYRQKYPDDIEFAYQTILGFRAYLQGLYIGRGKIPSDTAIGLFFQAVDPLVDMIDLISNLADLAKSSDAIKSVDDYQKGEARIAGDAAPWLKLNQNLLFSFKPELHRRVVALFLLLGSLSRGQLPGTPNLSYDDMFTITLARDGMATINV